MAYKVKQEIVQFIVESKKNNPKLSCRGLVDLIKLKLEIEVSKSSINAVIKEHNLSNHVGRTKIREVVSKPKELKQNIKGALSQIDKTLLSIDKEKIQNLPNEKKEELLLTSQKKSNSLLTFDPTQKKEISKKIICLKSDHDKNPPIESKGCNYLIDNVLDHHVGDDKIANKPLEQKPNKSNSWANRWIIRDEEASKNEDENANIFRGKLFKKDKIQKNEVINEITPEAENNENLDKLKEEIIHKNKEKEEIHHFSLSSESLVEEEQKLELEEQMLGKEQETEQEKEASLEKYSQSIVNKEDIEEEVKQEIQEQAQEPAAEVPQVQEEGPVEPQEEVKQEIAQEPAAELPQAQEEAQIEPKEEAKQEIQEQALEPAVEVPQVQEEGPVASKEEVKQEPKSEDEKKSQLFNILETKSYSDFIKEKLYTLNDESVSTRDGKAINNEDKDIAFVKDNDEAGVLNERDGLVKRTDSGWPDPKFEVPLEDKPKPSKDGSFSKDDMKWKIEEMNYNASPSPIIYPKFVKNGGIFFLKAADFATNMVGQLSDKFVGYLPELDFNQRKSFLQQVIYYQYVKDYLSLKVFVDQNISEDLFNKYTQELANSSFISIKDDLMKLKVYNNINSLNDLAQQIAYFLNSYVQDKFFPSVYHYLDIKAMFERFYCISAKIEETSDELNIKFYYPPELVWASDIIWIEDFASAAKAVNDARIFSPSGKKLIFNPVIDCFS